MKEQEREGGKKKKKGGYRMQNGLSTVRPKEIAEGEWDVQPGSVSGYFYGGTAVMSLGV